MFACFEVEEIHSNPQRDQNLQKKKIFLQKTFIYGKNHKRVAE